MIQIRKFVFNMFQENTYVVSDDTKDCVIIDCGAYYEEERQAIVSYIRDKGLTPRHLLATHGHVDHHFGDQAILDDFGLRVEVPAADERLMRKLPQQAAVFTGLTSLEFPAVGKYLSDDDSITFGSHEIMIHPTPGHSPGSVVFEIAGEGVIFTGDTLFHLSIGRTDLEGGSMMQLIQSLRSLAQMPDETKVYAGHGEDTTIGDELRMNPFMDR